MSDFENLSPAVADIKYQVFPKTIRKVAQLDHDFSETLLCEQAFNKLR